MRRVRRRAHVPGPVHGGVGEDQRAAVVNEKLIRKEYNEVYIDLNSASSSSRATS